MIGHFMKKSKEIDLEYLRYSLIDNTISYKEKLLLSQILKNVKNRKDIYDRIYFVGNDYFELKEKQ